METIQNEESAKLHPFQFTGKAGEYFNIWISNIFLSIATLGIYSAWAKVRRNRYFYANAYLQDSPFEYLADPVKILKGRLIVFGLFCLYYIPSKFLSGVLPLFVLLLLAFFAILMIIIIPWIVVKSLAFRARNSSYRNIRFRFKARYVEAMGVFVGLLLLSFLSLGLLYPYYVYRKNKFIINNSSYGQTSLVFFAPLKSFYSIYLKYALLFIIASLGGYLIVVKHPLANIGVVIAVFLVWFIPAYLKASVINLVWSHVSVGNNRFVSSLKTFNILWINFSNTLVMPITLGLMISWAKIRMMRYRIQNLKLMVSDDLDSFVTGEKEKVSAVGEEISDFYDMGGFFDVDFDIGV